jgi:RNA polymerase sigma-70 factor (ECF subfamily)
MDMPALPHGAAGNNTLGSDEEQAFATVTATYRDELTVHCYRMLGSLDDADDAVQETFFRAWKYRESLKAGLSVKPWLYRIATNVCFDAAAKDARRTAVAAKHDAPSIDTTVAEVTWLQPCPDALLNAAAPRTDEADARLDARETISLAFMAAIQLLTPQQRAVLILREVLGWSASETAELLDSSVASVNSTLQRARASLRQHFPRRKAPWPDGLDATEAERALLKKYMDASEQNDLGPLVALIREDAVFRMPPQPQVFVGRDTMVDAWVEGGFGSPEFGSIRCIATRANGQPAVANYVLTPGATRYKSFALDVLEIEDGAIVEIVAFPANVFAAFGLPVTLA